MIRPYRNSDMAAVLDAWYEASVIAHSFLPDEFFDAERQMLADVWIPQAETYVYERSGEVVGFVALVGDEVGGIFVHPSAQGQGVGKALMDHAVGLRGTVELEVFEKNSVGRGFYDVYGFVEVGSSVEPSTGEPQLRLRYG